MGDEKYIVNQCPDIEQVSMDSRMELRMEIRDAVKPYHLVVCAWLLDERPGEFAKRNTHTNL